MKVVMPLNKETLPNFEEFLIKKILVQISSGCPVQILIFFEKVYLQNLPNPDWLILMTYQPVSN